MDSCAGRIARTPTTPASRVFVRGFSRVVVAAASLLLGCCGGTSGGEQPAGPQISYVNTTGYPDSLLIGWQATPNTSVYALTRADRRGAQVFRVNSSDYLDGQTSDEDPLYRYSVQAVSADGTLSRPGGHVMVGNNRSMVAALNGALRSASTPADVKAILGDYMARYFDQVFVGLDATGLTYGDRALLFSFFVAHNYVPYANSQKYDLMQLLQERVLDCDNYVALNAQMFELLTDGTSPTAIRFYGFDGGAVGNHAQMVYTPGNGNEVWLVDPTVGLLARYGSEEQLFAGVEPRRVSDYYAYYESDTQPPDMLAFEERVSAAVDSGSYSPDEIIYRYTTLADFIEYHFIERSERIE